MRASEIESELKKEGYETVGVVAWKNREQYYAAGYESKDLPQIGDFNPVTDPKLIGGY